MQFPGIELFSLINPQITLRQWNNKTGHTLPFINFLEHDISKYTPERSLIYFCNISALCSAEDMAFVQPSAAQSHSHQEWAITDATLYIDIMENREELFNYDSITRQSIGRSLNDIHVIRCRGDKCRLHGEDNVWCESCWGEFNACDLPHLFNKTIKFSDIYPYIRYVGKTIRTITPADRQFLRCYYGTLNKKILDYMTDTVQGGRIDTKIAKLLEEKREKQESLSHMRKISSEIDELLRPFNS